MRFVHGLLYWSALLVLSQARFHPGTTTHEDPEPRLLHVFYYLWYGNPDNDGRWMHWDHDILEHWDPAIAKNYPSKIRFKPPHDNHSPYLPQRGCYSSRDPKTLDEHMKEIASLSMAGTTGSVAVVSWWGRPGYNKADSQGIHTDDAIPAVLDAAYNNDVKIAFHMEPYPDRTLESFLLDIAYITEKYASHPAFYRHAGKPVYYVYDSYRIPFGQWAQILAVDGISSIRNGPYDAHYIGLYLSHTDTNEIVNGGWDGGYSYFASWAFSFGSNSHKWPILTEHLHKYGVWFIPSVGPGYNDELIRPWNKQSTKIRRKGGYYSEHFKLAQVAKPFFISITSYNEWGEGTQIEPAIPGKRPDGSAYEDYEGNAPDFYIQRTRELMVPVYQRFGLLNQTFVQEHGIALDLDESGREEL